MNVLFVGGGRRVALARRFRAKGHRVFAYELGYSVPIIREASIIKGKKWDDPDIEDHFVKMVKKRNIDLILPLMDRAVVFCSLLDDIPQVVNLVSPKTTAMTCYDKLKFAQFMELYMPSIYPSPKGYPQIMKPRFGFGSKNIKVIKNNLDMPLEVITSVGQQYIFQSKIEGTEYSVDSYYSKDSQWIDSVSRERIRVGSGEVITSKTVEKPLLSVAALIIGETLGLVGPANLQFIEQGNGQMRCGPVYLFEVNARFGGGWTLSMEAGLDAISLIEHEYFGKPYKYIPDSWKRDLLLERSYEDHFFDT